MKTSIASVPKSAILISSMKAFLTAVIFLAVAVSVHAQGQMVISGADVSAVFSSSQNFNQTTESYWMITSIPTLTPVASSSGIGSVSPSSLTIQAVPEPSSFVLLAIGLLTGATIFRRKFGRSLPPT
jgi:hypothetical protein